MVKENNEGPYGDPGGEYYGYEYHWDVHYEKAEHWDENDRGAGIGGRGVVAIDCPGRRGALVGRDDLG